MIDEKTLAEGEKNLLETVSRYPDAKRLLMGEVEIIRNARRYLALRESGNFSASHVIGHKWGLRMTGEPLTESERAQLDAAADRLLENES